MIIVSFPGNAIKSEPAFLRYQHNVRFCYVQQSPAYNRLGKLGPVHTSNFCRVEFNSI